jgi:hypothetical protein
MRYIREQRTNLFDTTRDGEAWCTLVRLLESGLELRIKVVTQLDGGLRYGFDLGLPLPDGKPVVRPLILSSLMMARTQLDSRTTFR